MTPIACWSCGQPPEGIHFCRHCNSLQPPAGDYFEYLGLPQKLQLQVAVMEKSFYDLSRRLHPDIYFQRSERERLIAELASARLNDAYRTLRDRIARAEYLLMLHGVSKQERRTPRELVQEVFELNADLEQAHAGDDSVRARLRVARATLQETLREFEEALDASFAHWDQSGEQQVLESVADLLTARKFLLNLLEDLEAALA